MGRAWRLLPLRTETPAVNMATDDAILRAYLEGRVPPTLRFYAWEPPAVSCGRFQNVAREVDLAACATLGIAVVRRPTGGRAVLHLGDLTYAVVAGEQDGLPEGVIPAYLHLSRGLLAGLARLGIRGTLHTPTGRTTASGNPACFASPSWYELTVAGRKVIGSAQRREGRSVLQHGSIPLDFAPDVLAKVLRPPASGADLAALLAGAAAGLREFAPGLTPAAVAAAMAEGFCEALGIKLAEGELTGEELRMRAELIPGYTSVARRSDPE